MTLMKALHLAVVVAASVALCGSINEALAESSACHDLVGTYLTKNFAKGESGANFTSRSLLALSGSGVASFTDSGEGGEAGFGPFTDGRGSWRCIDANKLHAVTLDFTTPTAEAPKADIGRLDFDLAYDAASKTIKGTATLLSFRSAAIHLLPEAETGGNSRLSDSAWRRSKIA
jgi:hypothetical protein